VVHSSFPGTGLSQGSPTVGGDNESLAPKAVIDWLCGRGNRYTTPDGNETVEAYWSTGKVGMTGPELKGNMPGLVPELIEKSAREFPDYTPNIRPRSEEDARITSTSFLFF